MVKNQPWKTGKITEDVDTEEEEEEEGPFSTPKRGSTPAIIFSTLNPSGLSSISSIFPCLASRIAPCVISGLVSRACPRMTFRLGTNPSIISAGTSLLQVINLETRHSQGSEIASQHARMLVIERLSEGYSNSFHIVEENRSWRCFTLGGHRAPTEVFPACKLLGHQLRGQYLQ